MELVIGRGRLWSGPGTRLGLAGIAALIAVIGGAALLVWRGGDEAGTWLTYENTEHGYRIQYPVAWSFTAGATGCDSGGFCVQAIEIHGPDGEDILLYVNYQGGWCEEGLTSRREVVVSGEVGSETRCSDTIFRFFEGVHGRINHWLRGKPASDPDVERVLDSFEFITPD